MTIIKPENPLIWLALAVLFGFHSYSDLKNGTSGLSWIYTCTKKESPIRYWLCTCFDIGVFLWSITFFFLLLIYK